MRDEVGASYPVLADPDAEAASAYGIFDLLGDGVAAPATFIIAGGGLAASHVGQDIGDRVSGAGIVQALRELAGAGSSGRAG